jgi:hypothetical protein
MSIVELPKNILAILISIWLSLKEAILLDSAVCNNGQRVHVVNTLVFAFGIIIRTKSLSSIIYNQLVMWLLFLKDDFTLNNVIDQKISDSTNFVGDALINNYFNNSGLQKHNSVLYLNLCGFTNLDGNFLVTMCESCPFLSHLYFDNFIKPCDKAIKNVQFNNLITLSAQSQSSETILSLLLNQKSKILKTLCLSDGFNERSSPNIAVLFSEFLTSYQLVNKLIINSNKALLTDIVLGHISGIGGKVITHLDISNGGQFSDSAVEIMCNLMGTLKVLIFNDCKTISFNSFICIYNLLHVLEHIEFNQSWKPPNIVYDLLVHKFDIIYSLDLFRCKFIGKPLLHRCGKVVHINDFINIQIPKHDKKGVVFHSFDHNFQRKLNNSQLLLCDLTVGRNCIMGDQLRSVVNLCGLHLRSLKLFHTTNISSLTIEYIAKNCTFLDSIDLQYCDFVSFESIRVLFAANPRLVNFTFVAGKQSNVTDGICCILGNHCPLLAKLILQDIPISVDSLVTLGKTCSNLSSVCLWPDPPKSLTLKSVMKALKGCLNLEVCMIERTSNRTGY